MEKSKDRTKPVFRCRLLIVLLFFSAFQTWATNVDFFVSSFEFLQGETLRVELVVQDTDPAIASLSVSGVADSFVLLQSRKERRFRDTSFSLEWTVMEFREYSLGPFVLIVGEETIEMPEIHLVVGPPPVSDTTEVRWVIDESKPRVGKKNHIALEAFFTGTLESVLCPVPENALLEGLPLGDMKSTKGWSIIGQWSWTPLLEGRQSLPVALVEFSLKDRGNRKVASIPRFVSVEPPVMISHKAEISNSLLRAFAEVPELEEKNKKEIDIVKIERIAELRHTEYGSFFPSHIRKERELLEGELLLSQTKKVPYAAWKAISVIGSVVLIVVFFFSRVMSQRWSFFTSIARISFLCAGFLVFSAFFLYMSDRLGAAVVLSNQLRHVPENASSIITNVVPGSSVAILKRAGDWVYVETNEPVRGWIQAKDIIEYTRPVQAMD